MKSVPLPIASHTCSEAGVVNFPIFPQLQFCPPMIPHTFPPLAGEFSFFLWDCCSIQNIYLVRWHLDAQGPHSEHAVMSSARIY